MPGADALSHTLSHKELDWPNGSLGGLRPVRFFVVVCVGQPGANSAPRPSSFLFFVSYMLGVVALRRLMAGLEVESGRTAWRNKFLSFLCLLTVRHAVNRPETSRHTNSDT